jgi:hypothetical protein
MCINGQVCLITNLYLIKAENTWQALDKDGAGSLSKATFCMNLNSLVQDSKCMLMSLLGEPEAWPGMLFYAQIHIDHIGTTYCMYLNTQLKRLKR